LGRVATADTIAELILKFIALAEGATLEEAGLDADSVRAGGQDIRAYYEEALVALPDHVPAARQIES
jgi:hypothetical protein